MGFRAFSRKWGKIAGEPIPAMGEKWPKNWKMARKEHFGAMSPFFDNFSLRPNPDFPNSDFLFFIFSDFRAILGNPPCTDKIVLEPNKRIKSEPF